MIPKKPLLLDACVLIHLAKAGLLETVGRASFETGVLDLIKYDEFEYKKTFDLESLGYRIFTVSAEAMASLNQELSGLTYFDELQFNYCKKGEVIFMTADRLLYNKSMREGITVYGTLKLIDWLIEDGCIDQERAKHVLNIWKHDPEVFIPDSAIDGYLNKFK